MKVGDMIRQRKPTKHLINAVGLVSRLTQGEMVEVIWPGCAPFWTTKDRLKVINENR